MMDWTDTLSPWLAASLAASLAVLGALVVHRIGSLVLLRAARSAIVLTAVLQACRRAAMFVLPLVALQVVWQASPQDLRYIDNIRHLNGLLLIGALTWLALGAIGGLADGVIARNPSDVEDNLYARTVQTQARVLSRAAMVIVFIVGAALMLMTFPGARQVGASLLASAGVIGIVAGIAARPVFSNLIAGLQLALAQPLRLDDVLIVKGEWGRVEEITGSYVVLKIWDERRLIIPLQWFIENPFENWTRTSSQILGTVFLYLDYGVPLDDMRAEFRRIVEADPDWDKRVCVLHVTDASERAMQVRLLVSARSSGQAFDLRCRVREHMLGWVLREHPQALPQTRLQGELQTGPEDALGTANPQGAAT